MMDARPGTKGALGARAFSVRCLMDARTALPSSRKSRRSSEIHGGSSRIVSFPGWDGRDSHLQMDDN